MSVKGKLFALLLVPLFLAAACTTDSSTESGSAIQGESAEGCVEGTITVNGSSTVEPVTTKAARLYEGVCDKTAINVKGDGTGTGFEEFCEGKTDISDASRQIKQSEIDLCEKKNIPYVELKVAFDGITVMTSQENEAISCLSFVDLYALLGGKSKGFDKWSDANDLAKELGSALTYPDADLDIGAPGTESGTYDSFVEIVLEGIGEEEEGEDGTFVRTDYPGQSDDNNIIQIINGSPSSLGWVGFAFADQNKDKVKILEVSKEPGGTCVAPSSETIADKSYPVNRELFIYVNTDKMVSNPAVVPFVDYYLSDAYKESVTKAFGESGYIALPQPQLDETLKAWGDAKA